jgi:hypothetical protein
MSNVNIDFVNTAKKILASTRQILTTLHLIREDVKTIRDQSVEDGIHKGPKQQTSDPNKEQGKGVSIGSHVLNENEARSTKPKNENQTKPFLKDFVDRLKRKSRNPRFVIEVLTLMGLLAYVCETTRTNDLTEKAIQLTRDQQRPFDLPSKNSTS